ncbi:MAG: heparinase II/III family protein [Chitinophagaceae bacterium]
MKLKYFKINLLTLVLLIGLQATKAQQTQRPMIWVKTSDKQAILNDIEHNQWKKDYYEAFVKRIQPDLKEYANNPKAYLGDLPYDLSLQKEGQIPPFRIIIDKEKDAAKRRDKLQHYLKTGIDCGVIYYLTGEEKYAEYATSVFYTFMKSMLQIQPSDEAGNGGWIYQDNHLREAREIGAQIPILYDFIYPYFIKGGKAYDFVKNTKEIISIPEAEKVFKTYIDLAVNHGIINCNWPVLEASSLVSNTLALDNETERIDDLKYYLEKDTPHQDALPKVANVFKESGSWPESLNYAGGVTGLTTYLMELLTRVYPTLNLGAKYPEVLTALTNPYYLTYPNNNETIIFGDGHRHFQRNYGGYETAYLLAKTANNKSLMMEFGSLINSGIATKDYDRDKLKERSYEPEPYFGEPLKLLWYAGTVVGAPKDYPKPTTNILPFAGVVIQRNLSETNKPEDGLMSFVGGGASVHGHASGMNMELYGKGFVLGSKGGRSAYGTEDHENYYRIFAGHNTVIVNGSSRGEGEWSNDAINTVKKEALEPEANQTPVSKNNSFSITSFLDDKGDKAEAKQLRTMAIVRTSPTTGYYVDVYKSKSSLPNEYHDYVYHNIGDELSFVGQSKSIDLKEDVNRYMANADSKWGRNKEYKNPGWHYFKDVQTSGVYNQNVDALFTAKSLGSNGVNMRLFIPGAENREYTKVMAPPSTESDKAYEKKPTPTLVIRKTGEAWQNPFAVIYEPFTGSKSEGTISNVKGLSSNGVFKGFMVESTVDKKKIKQFIITQDDDNAIFEDKTLGIKFKGRYVVITLDQNGEIQSIYVGSGSELHYQKWSVKSSNGKSTALNLVVTNQQIIVTTNNKVEVMNPKNYKLKMEATK